MYLRIYKFLFTIFAICSGVLSCVNAQSCAFTLGNNLSFCSTFSHTLQAPGGFTTYSWSPGGATTQSLQVSSFGTYSCTASVTGTNLVVNGDFSNGNTGFTSNYTNGTVMGPWGLLSNPGQYAVTTNPNAVHVNFNTFGDHTTGAGNMLVCNGASNPNDIVWSQTITVVPNTNYNFSAWIASVENTTQANAAQMQFSINNNLIGAVTTAPLMSGLWSNFAVAWNSGTVTTAVITIVDQNVSSGGNDFALDDIFFSTDCSHTSTITISQLTTPTVIANATQPILCLGNTSTLFGSGASTYTWTSGIIDNVPFTPNTSSAYTVVGTAANGCTNSAVTTVSVVSTSPVALAVPANICQDATANLNANAAGAVAYTWNGPSNFISNSANPSIANILPVSSGNYSATAIFALGNYSCTTSAVAPLNVVATNSVTVNSPIVKCEKEQTQFMASSPNALSYTWNGPNGYSINNPSPQLTNLTPSVSGIYTITTSYNNGVLTCFRSNTLSLTVNPILEFTLTPDSRVCYNSNVTINGPAGGTSYLWTSTNTFSSTSQNLNISGITTLQQGTYFLELSLGNCKTYGSTVIDVISPIVFSVTPTNKTICLGDSVKHTVLSSGGTENYAYNWIPNIYLSYPTGSVQSGMPLGTTVYQLVGWDIACPQYSITHTFSVIVNQPPKPDLKLEKTSGCSPLCLTFDTHTSRKFSRLVTWDFGDIKQQGDSIQICLSKAGTYDLNILINDSNNCSSKTTLTNAITVFPLPQTEINLPPDISTTNNTINFTSTSLHGPITNYLWQFGDISDLSKDTSTFANPTHVYDSNYPGQYTVFLQTTNEYGCTEITSKTFDIAEEFSFYIPNTFTPNGDGLNEFFHPKGVGFREKGFSMDIFDRWGTRVYSTTEYGKGWDGTVKGNPAADGVYIYKIRVATLGSGKREFAGHVNLIR